MVEKYYQAGPKYKPTFTVAGISLKTITKWSPTLTLWGAATGSILFFFADSIPVFKHNFYQKLPIVGQRYDDSVAAEDTPF